MADQVNANDPVALGKLGHDAVPPIECRAEPMDQDHWRSSATVDPDVRTHDACVEEKASVTRHGLTRLNVDQHRIDGERECGHRDDGNDCQKGTHGRTLRVWPNGRVEAVWQVA